MPTTRRLTDLYQVGKEVKIDDGSDDPVVVYMAKLNPAEQQKALKRANAVRSKIRADTRRPDSDAHIEKKIEVEHMERNELIEILIARDIAEARASVEAEVEAEEHWSEEGYLQGLYDAWEDGLRDDYFSDERSDEAQHVFDEIKKYAQEVNEKLEVERERLRKRHEHKDRQKLENECVDELLMQEAELAWMTAFKKAEIVLSLKDPEDHSQQYLSFEEIDHLQQPVLERLYNEYRALTVGVTEGKD